MEPIADIIGVEFDWLVQDREGCIALFATAGSGMALPSAAAASEALDAVFASIDKPHVGSLSCWDDYAVVGLYVYDWNEWSGPYRRQRLPAAAMSPKLQALIRALPDLPRIDSLFATQETINLEEVRG